MTATQRDHGRILRCAAISVTRARGAAVVMAMLVVAVTATLVAGVFWRQNVLIRQAENELSYAQARWLLRGAIDWAGVILREDARTSGVDHLGETWAVPLAETRLNEDDGRQPLYLAGQIRDAQAKFNLRNLAAAGGVVPQEVDAFRRLLAIVGLDQSLADPIADRVLSSLALANGKAPTMIAVSSVEDLLAVKGLTPEAIERLRPFVTALPQPTPVNANTASAEVLSARIADLSLADARRLAASRDRSYFRDAADVLSRLGGPQLTAGNNDIAVATRYFAVEGTVTYGRAHLHADALLRRDANRVEMLWLREPV
jgi:general secretion pathway protein K